MRIPDSQSANAFGVVDPPVDVASLSDQAADATKVSKEEIAWIATSTEDFNLAGEVAA